MNKKQEELTLPISVQDIQDKLSEGELLSYKEIVNRLSLPSLTGNQKKAQLKQLERYFSYEKIKTKYLITEIYETMRPINRQMRKDAVYIPAMNIFLMNYLSKYEDGYITHTPKQWWELIGMVNKKYINAYNNKYEKYKALTLDKDMDKYNIDFFFSRTSNKFSSVFKKSLQALYKRGVLRYHNIFIITKDNKQYKATDAEEQEIMRIRKNVIEEMGLEDFSQLFYISTASVELFYKKVNQKIKDKLGWDNVHEEIAINYLPEYIPLEILRDKKKLQEMSDEAEKELNNFCVQWSRNNAQYEYEKRKEKLAIGIKDTFNPYLQNVLTDEYISI